LPFAHASEPTRPDCALLLRKIILLNPSKLRGHELVKLDEILDFQETLFRLRKQQQFTEAQALEDHLAHILKGWANGSISDRPLL
jgi:hypothetical protein